MMTITRPGKMRRNQMEQLRFGLLTKMALSEGGILD